MSLQGPRTAFGNPVDTSKLPKEPLTRKWRAISKVRRHYSIYVVVVLLGIMLFPLVTKLLAIFLANTSVSPVRTFFPFVAFFALIVVVQLLLSVERVHWAILGCLLVTFFRQGPPSLIELLLALGLTVWCVQAFRKHYTEYCLAAPIPEAVAVAFRNGGHLPGKVTPIPKMVDFWNGIVCWFEYNIDNHYMPGVLQSPAGAQWLRLLIATAVVTLLTITVQHYLLLKLATHGPQEPISLILGIALAHCAPILIASAAVFMYCFPILGKAGGLLRSASLANYWTEFQSDLGNSPNTVERDSLILGQVVADSSPVMPTLKTANSHFWISGSTGAGKTALLMCLLEQFIHRRYSVLCMDLKATSFELYYTLLSLAQRDLARQLPTWHFTNRNGWSTQLCSPFEQTFWRTLSSAERTNVHLSSMGLGFSRDYGEAWYTDTTYALLDLVNQKYPNIASYQELHDRIKYELAHAPLHELSKKVRSDGEQVALIIGRLKDVEMFNQKSYHSQSSKDAALDFGGLFATQGLAYWGLNPLISPISTSEISRVVLGTLLAAATNVRNRNRNLLLVIDEFQQMVAPGVLQLALRQARSLDISVLLLNQTVDDLKTTKNNFIPTVEGNTAIQMWLNAAGRDSIDQIQRLGGKYIDHLYSESCDAQGVRRTSRQEVLVDRFDATTIARASSERGQYIVRITNNDGYAQYDSIPFIARSEFHLPSAEYLKRSSTPWPSHSATSVVVGQTSPATPSPAVSMSAVTPSQFRLSPAPNVAPFGRPQRTIIGSGTLRPKNP